MILPKKEVLFASDEVRDLIEKILVKEDEQRIKLADIETHVWYKDYNHPEYVIEDEEEEEDVVVNMYSNRDKQEDCCVVV